MKKTLAWLLTLFMVLTISTVSVFAADTDVAKIGETGYASLTDAIAALNDGDTLTIFEGTYDAALTIKKSNVTVIGQGNVVLNGVPTLRGTNYRVENIDFNYSDGYNNLSGSGLIKDCTFTATENTFRYCYGANNGSITFEGTTFNPASGKWAVHFDSASGTDLTFTDCVINGRVALASDLGSLTATGTEFNKAYVNVWGTETGATFEKCEFNDVPYVFTGYDADNKFDFNDCTVVTNGNSANVADIIYGGIDNADAKIYEDEVLIGGGVAKIGDIYFLTLQAALDAAQNGDTIVVNSPDTAISAAGSVYGKTVTITGTAKFDWSKGWLFVGRGGEGDGTLIFDNATIISGSNSSSFGIHVSGREKDTSNKYDGTLVIKNSNIELDYLINRNNIEVDNSTLTVKNGFGIAGRPANETESGTAATATIDVKNGSTLKVLNHNGMGVGVASSAKEGNGVLNLTDSTFECANFNIDGSLGDFNVYGESVLKIAALTGKEIDLHHNAIIKNSIVGGEVMLYGKVTFRGDNTFAMLYDYGNAYSTEYAEWIVEKGASVTLTDKARYGLGYGDKLTIYGNIEDALAARASLTEDDISVFMHGLVAMSSWDVEHSMTVKDAYVVLGSNNSFGNKPGNYAGTYAFTFDNVVLDSSRITFYSANSKTEFTFNKSDVKVGTFMIRDADSVFTLTDTKLVSTTTTNGADEGNYLAGALVLNNSSLSYAAPLVMENGSLTIDMTSTLAAPSISGAGKIIIDTTGMTAGEVTVITGDLSGFTGTVEVVGDESLEAYIEDGKIYLKNVVAKIGDVYYETLETALKAVKENDTVELLCDITITSDWDNRNTGAKIAVPVTIDGNGYTLKFTGMITDGYNYLSAFRFEAAATVKDLTIDLSEATSQWAPRLRAISAKTDITIDNCTFIGNAAYNNTNAVIIGEGAGAAMGDVVITITNSTFTNWRNGISDNQNGQDAKTVTVTGNTFNNANARIAAKNSVVFNNNTMNNGGVTIASFTTPASLAVTAKGNTLATGDAIVNEIKNANTIDAQTDFVGAVATVNGTIYGSLEAAFAAAANNSTVTLIADVDAAVTYGVIKTLTLDLNGYTIESDAAATLTAAAGKLTIVDNSTAQTGSIVSNGNKAIHSSASVAIQSGKFVGTITTANGQIDDSQVCITGGTFTQNPDADLVEHSYTVLTNEDGTYTVVDTEYTLTIINAGANASGAGIYIYGDIVTVYAGEMNGYFFGEWGSEDVDVTGFTSDTVTFVMPDHDVTLTVYWSTHGPANPSTPVVLPGTLNFETNGGTPIDSISRVAGTKVDLSQFVTVREGYTFTGWYSDAALTKPVTAITVRSTKTVYAGWIQNAVTPDIPVVVMPFTDVAADAYYYNAVLWAVNTGITTGMTDTMFGPDLACTRAQVVTFLWRAAGCPVASNDAVPFADVSRDMYYYDAVLWAVEKGITNGISATEFAPDAECSRAQIVTFLWRALGAPDAAADAGFVDVDADAYYATAVEWAVDNGITNGMGDNTFGADADCTRGQTVTFLFRFFCK